MDMGPETVAAETGSKVDMGLKMVLLAGTVDNTAAPVPDQVLVPVFVPVSGLVSALAFAQVLVLVFAPALDRVSARAPGLAFALEFVLVSDLGPDPELARGAGLAFARVLVLVFVPAPDRGLAQESDPGLVQEPGPVLAPVFAPASVRASGLGLGQAKLH